MIDSPLFSVIIPTYNRAEALKRCLESLVAQSFKNFEVIVCDDGSTDHSKQIVKEFENTLSIKYFWNENWGGPAKPRNIGIKNSSAEWICFLDSDDWWYPEKLEVTQRYISKSDVLFHTLDEHKDNKVSVMELRSLVADVFQDLLVNGNTIPNSSVAVRKNLVEQVGYISEDRDFIAIEDYDLWLKISRVTNKFRDLGSSLGAYWIGESGSNISFDAPEKLLLREYKILNKFRENLPLALQQKKEMLIHRNVAWFCKQRKDFKVASKHFKTALCKVRFISLECISIRMKLLGNYLFCMVLSLLPNSKSSG